MKVTEDAVIDSSSFVTIKELTIESNLRNTRSGIQQALVRKGEIKYIILGAISD
jgi:hypothetical protein